MTRDQQLAAIRDACIRANPEKLWERYVGPGKVADTSIRLADVLLAVQELESDKKPMYFNIGSDGGFYSVNYSWPDGEHCKVEHTGLGASWNLRKDRLEDQSKECVAFLYELLK